MKNSVLVMTLLLCLAGWATADEITFSFIELGNGAVNLTSDTSGLTAGPALNIVVSDTAKGLQFPLSGVFNATSGPSSAITTSPTMYAATFTSGGAVTIAQGGTIFISGSPMFDGSHLTSNLSLDTGSYQGEFTITSVDPSVLAMFGLGPGWKPDGSVSITFGQSSVSAETLTGVIGGGTVTFETQAPVPEAATIFLFIFGIGTLVAFSRMKEA